MSNETKMIWIVEGACGQYSDYCSWIVCAYPTEKQAKDHAELAQKYADDHKRKCEAAPDYSSRPKKESPHDSQFQTDYTGTHYSSFPIELKP